jgi:NADH:ubiquinone oxidoreductase subunit D
VKIIVTGLSAIAAGGISIAEEPTCISGGSTGATARSTGVQGMYQRKVTYAFYGQADQ